MNLKRSRELRRTREGRRLVERDRVWVEATENLCVLMERSGITRAELARRLGKSPAYISKMLSGTQNLTLATLSDAFFELDRSMHISYAEPTERVVIVKSRRRRPVRLAHQPEKRVA
jgi:transcriptional regulator with XRE-family HTH domain